MSNNNQAIELNDLELPIQASASMEYSDPVIKITGSKMEVGYLADDYDAPNPLEECDGLGRIYTSHRHGTTHDEMQEALALDSSWEPNLELVTESDEKAVISLFRKEWVKEAVQSADFQIWAMETSGPTAKPSDAYYRRRANKVWNDTEAERDYGATWVDDFEFTDSVALRVWQDLREQGKIGNRHAVSLDCYSHGGEHWSLSGSGMQCRWDTASGAGVWVPDQCALEEIERRAKVYAYGEILDLRGYAKLNQLPQFQVKLDQDLFPGQEPVAFATWADAFEWLETQSRKKALPRRKADREACILRGNQLAAEELASSSLEDFNEWLMGNVYGAVIATYRNEGTDDAPHWVHESEDSTWGYIGAEATLEVLQWEIVGDPNQQSAA